MLGGRLTRQNVVATSEDKGSQHTSPKNDGVKLGIGQPESHRYRAYLEIPDP